VVKTARGRGAADLRSTQHRLARVSVDVGYDDSPLARHTSTLTTVSQNTQQQAEHAVAAAVERLDEQCSAPREVVLSPRLAIRRTAASTPLVWLITPREIAVGGSGQLT
jgi:DNA-binding LacI/PurR family transcriptional regulator